MRESFLTVVLSDPLENKIAVPTILCSAELEPG